MISEHLGVSIFFPCFNDKESISKLVKEAFSVIRNLTRRYEVIVVDDGSTDGSVKLLQNLQTKYKSLKVIFHKQNQGYGGALRSGFKAAKHDLVFYTDGDGQYDIKELPILLSLMSSDVDFVNGIKMTRHDPTYRIFIGNLYSFITRWVFWLPIMDVDCDFRLIRKRIIKKLNLRVSSGAICIELVKKAQRKGAVFRQVSTHHFERKHGASQFFRIERVFTSLSEVFILWVKLMFIYNIKKLVKKFRLQLYSPYLYNPTDASQK